MNKKYIIGIVVAVIILIAAAIVFDVPIIPGQDTEDSPASIPRPRNGTYTIEGETVPFKDGETSVQVDAGVFVKYEYLVQADGLLNEDNITDSGVIITGETGGSGTFYYAAALVSTPTGEWVGTNAILLGDRIKMGMIDVSKDRFFVTYETRKASESFSVAPSVEVTRYFQVRNGVFVEVGTGVLQ